MDKVYQTIGNFGFGAVCAIRLFVIMSFAAIVGCSDNEFQSVPTLNCDNSADQSSDCVTGRRYNTYTFSFRSGEVDVLFVNDNSGSMFVEQSKMGSAFPNFISRLDNLFFKLAMVSTDTTGSSAGQLIQFESSAGVLSGLTQIEEDTPNVENLFLNTVRRSETLRCDQNNYASAFCPSGDERGIYAALLAVRNGPKSFFRTGAHLAVVVLSDEDERSTGGTTAGFPLEQIDTPANFLRELETKYPTKSVSFHSVIIKPGDSGCLSAQYQVPPNGFPTVGRYGHQYAAIADPATYAFGAGITEDLFAAGNLLRGDVGSICESDYGVQMGDIGRNVRANAMSSPKKLSCRTPFTFNITTVPSGSESQIVTTFDSKGRVSFSNVPLGVEVKVTYQCDRFST